MLIREGVWQMWDCGRKYDQNTVVNISMPLVRTYVMIKGACAHEIILFVRVWRSVRIMHTLAGVWESCTRSPVSANWSAIAFWNCFFTISKLEIEKFKRIYFSLYFKKFISMLILITLRIDRNTHISEINSLDFTKRRAKEKIIELR